MNNVKVHIQHIYPLSSTTAAARVVFARGSADAQRQVCDVKLQLYMLIAGTDGVAQP